MQRAETHGDNNSGAEAWRTVQSWRVWTNFLRVWAASSRWTNICFILHLEKLFILFVVFVDEQEREVIKMQIEEETSRIEMEQAIQQRKEYIRFVTDEIMQHIIDMGITLFFPHVMKEAYRKTADIADKMELSCKDRKCIKIKPEMMEILYYEIDNPLDEDVLNYVFTKEILIFLWKLGETDTRSPEEVLQIFHKTVAEPSNGSFIKFAVNHLLKFQTLCTMIPARKSFIPLQRFSSPLSFFQVMNLLLLRSLTWAEESQQHISKQLPQCCIWLCRQSTKPLESQWRWWKFQLVGRPKIEEPMQLLFIFSFAMSVWTFHINLSLLSVLIF